MNNYYLFFTIIIIIIFIIYLIYLNYENIQVWIMNRIIVNQDYLVADWEFKAGSDNILYDHSGNGNHGNIHGATWVETIEGCTDEFACNYNSEANINNGECDYSCNSSFDLSNLPFIL